MKITIITIGSQGDIVPYLALAKGLIERGHTVRIAALSRFKGMVEQYQCTYFPLAGDADEVIRRLIGVNVGPAAYFRNLDQMMLASGEQIIQNVWDACAGADAVLYSVLGSLAWHIAQKMGIPAFRAFPCPLDPTPDFPTMTAPALPLGGGYNLLTYRIGDWLWGWVTWRHFSKWRTKAGLPQLPFLSFPYRRQNGGLIHTLYMFSPTVVPLPCGWGPQHHITGYWFLDESVDWQPPAELNRFLDSGAPPLYIGFGSMLGGSFRGALDMILQSLQRTGQRAVLSSGWGNLTQADLPDSVLKIDYVPHDWLFARVAAVVHHGGAGTTAAGLRAGCPTLVIPFGGDQPFWAQRVHALGAGPRPIHRKDLSTQRLTQAFAELANNAGYKAQAAAIASRIRCEDGAGTAIRLIEQYTPDRPGVR